MELGHVFGSLDGAAVELDDVFWGEGVGKSAVVGLQHVLGRRDGAAVELDDV
jgi:hypothetical protein